MSQQRNVAILLYDDVEVLDFAGPFEVFNVTAEMVDNTPFAVYTVAVDSMPVMARGKLSVNPTYSIDDCPAPDILIIPGGWGSRAQLKNDMLVEWIQTQAEQVELLLSVCTGSLLLAKAGLLEGLTCTTHGTAFDALRQLAPNATVVEDKRYIDNGKIITSGGISAGIDMSLYVVQKLLGDDAVKITTTEMEYPWTADDKQWNA